MKKIAVMGAGAIGSSVGADLTRAEFDVTIFDQWPEHVEVMKKKGLHIQFPDEDLKIPVRAHHFCELASVKMEFDIALIIVKSYDTRWVAELISPYLKSEGVVVGMQNGMNNEAIASILGRDRTIGCVVELSGEIFTPGLVQRDTTRPGTWFAVGELDGSFTPRLKEVQSLLTNVGVTELTNNIEGSKWTKLIANSMTMGPFGSFGLTNWEAARLPGMSDISVRLGRESMAVGEALGYRMEPIFGLTEKEFSGASDEVLITAMKTLMRHVGSKSTTAPIHDHIKGRRSEMEFINGLVSKKGKELGIPTPYNDSVTEMALQIDRGELKMDISNFDLLKTRLGLAD